MNASTLLTACVPALGAAYAAGRRSARSELAAARDQLAVARQREAALQSRLATAEQACLRDGLTGIGNRTYLEAALAYRAASADPFAVILVDLDEFKQVNDTFGHAAGDAVLIEAAHRLAGVISDDDLVARLGGDEFAIIAAGPMAAAWLVADRACATMRPPITVGPGRQVRVTASVGLVHALPGDAVRAVLNSADIALYEAKAGGRNRLVEYGAGKPLATVPAQRRPVRRREVLNAARDCYDLVGATR